MPSLQATLTEPLLGEERSKSRAFFDMYYAAFRVPSIGVLHLSFPLRVRIDNDATLKSPGKRNPLPSTSTGPLWRYPSPEPSFFYPLGSPENENPRGFSSQCSHRERERERERERRSVSRALIHLSLT